MDTEYNENTGKVKLECTGIPKGDADIFLDHYNNFISFQMNPFFILYCNGLIQFNDAFILFSLYHRM